MSTRSLLSKGCGTISTRCCLINTVEMLWMSKNTCNTAKGGQSLEAI